MQILHCVSKESFLHPITFNCFRLFLPGCRAAHVFSHIEGLDHGLEHLRCIDGFLRIFSAGVRGISAP